jgi:hypothetical protein
MYTKLTLVGTKSPEKVFIIKDTALDFYVNKRAEIRFTLPIGWFETNGVQIDDLPEVCSLTYSVDGFVSYHRDKVKLLGSWWNPVKETIQYVWRTVK